MKKNGNRILLAVDGSSQAMDAVRYAGAFFSATRTELVLYHVQAESPEAFLDLMRDPEYRSDGLPVGDWHLLVHRNISEFLDEAERILVEAGVPRDRVCRTIRERQSGVARDLLNESREGYDAVILGRIGLSNMKDVTMGSVAQKLASLIHPVPIAVVSGKPEPRKVLVAFDGSAGAMRAVERVGSLMFHEDREVTLCHVVRSLGIHWDHQGSVFLPEHEQLWLDASREEIEPAFDDAEKKLIVAGFHPGHVYMELLENATSRAAGIRDAAETGDFGTVVLGRRGLSAVEEFPMGRVPMKMLQAGAGMAVWIV